MSTKMKTDSALQGLELRKPMSLKSSEKRPSRMKVSGVRKHMQRHQGRSSSSQ